MHDELRASFLDRSGTMSSPIDVLPRWPTNLPLAAIVACDEHAAPGWSIFAAPAATVQFWEYDAGDLVRHIVRHKRCEPPMHEDERAPIMEQLRAMFVADAGACESGQPFIGGWLGWMSYEAGRLLEPAARYAAGPTADRPLPIAEWHWCPDAYVHDGVNDTWTRVGDPPSLLELQVSNAPPARCGRPRVSMTRRAYMAKVARVISYIRAGDIFQANLTHRLSTRFSGPARAAFVRLVHAAAPRHGAYFESDDGMTGLRHAVLSTSPELFLRFDPRSRLLTTRPMKGTRPGDSPRADLEGAPKDRAELNMIVDLMRNDIGRVCELGSVRVASSRDIERHGTGSATLWQAVATVTGRLRRDRTIVDALAAAFPAGSITGAPKIRAMQIIEELEAVRRGPYCGCAGYVSRCGAAALNVAIRTAVITGIAARDGVRRDEFERATLDYGVGAGIVVDSDPLAEWRETLGKAGILRAILREAPSHATAGSAP